MILVAHDSETIRGVISQLLLSAGWRVRTVADGPAVRAALADPQLEAVVLDVALSGVLAYQLVDELRSAGRTVKVVLVASIYNRTGYKRRPTSLYGADDYVEQHHIPDALVPKLAKLLGGPPRTVTLPDPHRETPEGKAIREESLRTEDLPPPSPALLERAQRLARLIVADVALYNGDALDHAANADDPTELEARLRLDLEEGRLLFDLRIPEAVRRMRDFIGDALDELRLERRLALGRAATGKPA